MAAVLPHILAMGIDIHLAVLTKSQSLIPIVEDAGVSVYDLSGRGFVQQVIALRSLITDLRPALIHSTLFQASVPSQVAALATPVPSLVTWANTPTDPRTELAPTWKLRVVHAVEVGFAHLPGVHFHAVTEGVARTKGRSLRVHRSKVRVAERGRDRSAFHPPILADRLAARAALGLADSDRVLLAVGRQEPQKGYVDLVHAFEEAANVDPSLHLVIAGRPGSATSEVVGAVKAMRHGDRVHLLGHRSDIGELMGMVDAVVCASYREGAAGALIEAMACGTPILSVELDGMIGVLEDGVNAAVVPRDHLAAGILDVLGDPGGARRRAEVASAMFEQRFTIQRSAEALFNVYRWAGDLDPEAPE